MLKYCTFVFLIFGKVALLLKNAIKLFKEIQVPTAD